MDIELDNLCRSIKCAFLELCMHINLLMCINAFTNHACMHAYSFVQLCVLCACLRKCVSVFIVPLVRIGCIRIHV